MTWQLPFPSGTCGNMAQTQCFLLLASYLFFSVSGLYFHIGETERKCFIEEIPDETMVVGKFHSFLLSFSFHA